MNEDEQGTGRSMSKSIHAVALPVTKGLRKAKKKTNTRRTLRSVGPKKRRVVQQR